MRDSLLGSRMSDNRLTWRVPCLLEIISTSADCTLRLVPVILESLLLHLPACRLSISRDTRPRFSDRAKYRARLMSEGEITGRLWVAFLNASTSVNINLRVTWKPRCSRLLSFSAVLIPPRPLAPREHRSIT